MRLVVIGGGIAGLTTARLAADRDPSMHVALFSQESQSYYPRPRLIELVACQVTPGEMVQFPDAWYVQHRIEAHWGQTVAAIRPETHEVTLSDGTAWPYDRLVLATGARNWVPPIPGAHLDGVVTLRTLDDAEALCRRASAASRAVILGGGLLGLDTSSALLAHHLEVTVLEALPRLLPRQLDREGAVTLQGILEERGLHVVTGVACECIEGDGRVERLVLKDGSVLPADLVVVSVGVRSEIGLAQAAGLACNRGIIVDERMATSAPGIYAVGDCAEFRGAAWQIIPVALAQARVAAAQVAGDASVLYEGVVPSTTLKVSGIDLTSIGEVNPEKPGFIEVRETGHTPGVYKKAVVRDGRMVGAILLGDRADVRALNQLISRGIDVSAHIDRLFSEGFDLTQLVSQ